MQNTVKYKLQDLIDIQQFQELHDRLNNIYSFPAAIIDLEGNVLTATAWQDVCTKFHRVNEQCERDCKKSDLYILEHLSEANPAVSYKCPRGLIDNATPIIIDGVHYGNYFTGQFFLKKPDLDFYKQQAKEFGFDESAYIDAVKKVPVWSKKQLDNYLFFIKGLIEVISESGLKRLQEIEARNRVLVSEDRYQNLSKDLPIFVTTFLPDGTITFVDKI
jgi:ligand-binding sensor protein